LHQVGDLYELNVKLQCQKVKGIAYFKLPTPKFINIISNVRFSNVATVKTISPP